MASEESAAEARWRRLVTDRIAEMQRLSPAAGSFGDGSFWDRRADRGAAGPSAAETEGDPFLRRLRRAASPSSTAIDVGAGAGRFALPLAREVQHVTAIDPSAGMLGKLERDAAELGLTNVTVVKATWQEAPAASADIVFSSFVLMLVPDVRRFVEKLEAAARHHVFLYLGAHTADAVLDPLWRHFHGAPRAAGATYIDALAVLRELGIAPEVRLVEIANRKRFATVAEAAEYYREWLLVEDTPEATRELERLLADWLLGRRGAFRSPLRSVPAAIIRWSPRARP